MINAKILTILSFMTGLMDKQHRRVIEYLKEENEILREHIRDKCGSKRIVLTNRQRKRLAARAKELGRKLLGETTDLFTPSTILGWYRSLIAKKYDGSANRRGGKPKISQEKIDIVLRMAKENPGWGAGRISNWMKHLDYPISKSSVWRIMEDNGFNPDPIIRRKGDWNRFIKSHFDVLAATDFFSVELLTPFGLVRYMVLFVIDIKTRKVDIAGIQRWPDGVWMKQIARNWTDCMDGFLRGKRYLIHDCDSLFTKEFASILKAGGVKVMKTPKQSPNLNAYAERFVWTIKYECLNHLILSSEDQLRYVIDEFMEHYHHERPHEGLGGKLIDPKPQATEGPILKSERLGGLLTSYQRVRLVA